MPPVDQPIVLKANEGSSTSRDEEEFKAALELVRHGNKILHNTLNPPGFEEAAQNVFPENQAKKLLDEHFKVLTFPCGIIYPDENNCPREWRVFEEEGEPIHDTQEWVVAIPNKHLKRKSQLALEVYEPFHGGGGVSSS